MRELEGLAPQQTAHPVATVRQPPINLGTFHAAVCTVSDKLNIVFVIQCDVGIIKKGESDVYRRRFTRASPDHCVDRLLDA
jgi:hypothetical protein